MDAGAPSVKLQPKVARRLLGRESQHLTGAGRLKFRQKLSESSARIADQLNRALRKRRSWEPFLEAFDTVERQRILPCYVLQRDGTGRCTKPESIRTLDGDTEGASQPK